MSSMVVLFCGLYLGSYRAIQKGTAMEPGGSGLGSRVSPPKKELGSIGFLGFLG